MNQESDNGSMWVLVGPAPALVIAMHRGQACSIKIRITIKMEMEKFNDERFCIVNYFFSIPLDFTQ